MNVLIAGAGIAGLTAAISFALRGADVVVLEQAHELGDVGAGIQLSANAMHVMQSIGLNNILERRACEPIAGTLRNYKTGRPYFSQPLKSAHERRYGAKYLHVHRADLISSLYEKALSVGVKIHLGQTLTSYRQVQTSIEAKSNTGNLFSSDLLIGADGIHSCVRDTLLANNPAQSNKAQFTGQVAWRGVLASTSVRKGIIPPDANVWLGPGRHFVAYYLRGGELINFIAVEERKSWAEESWSTRGDIEALRSAFSNWDPAIGELLEATNDCYLWGLFDRPPLSKWHDGRAVLIGDACHPMLPFMAQGGAMSIEDAYVLAAEVMRNANLGKALEAYEASRKPRTEMVQAISRANAKLYHAGGPTSELKKKLQFSVATALPQIAHYRFDKIYGVDVTA